jgi:hypothetical protein
MSLVYSLGEIHAVESETSATRCAHGAQFISLCTNKPISPSCSTTNVSVGVDVFLQDVIITVSTTETGSPVLLNLTVTNTLSAPTACATDITTDELQVWDNLGATLFANLYDYEVLRSNRSIFPTFGGELLITSTDAIAGDSFGRAVALSGDGSTMVIGAQGKNGGRGTAYVFERQTVSWAQVVEIPDPIGTPGDNFGARVAISEDQSTIVIAANAGASGLPTVYVYNYVPLTNRLTLLQTIQGVGGSIFGLGIAVSATGEYIAISDNSASPQGFVYVRQNSNCILGSTWALQQILTTQAGSGSQIAISADGTVIAIGVASVTVPLNQGIVYIYTNQNNVWTFKQTVTSNDIAALDFFGSAVSLSSDGKYLLVGARGKTPNGKAYEFVRRGQTWLQENTFLPTGSASSFGSSIDISGDGTVALFGAAVTSTVGNAFIDFRSPDNNWTQPFNFTGHLANAAFGFSVALSADGAFAAVGAPDLSGVTSGTVSMFSPIGSLIPSDAIITGSLCVYSQVNVNGDLFVTGSIFTNGFVVSGGVTPCTPSDLRIKKNIQPLLFEHAWKQLKKLKPVTFTWKNPEEHSADGSNPAGFIAQEVKKTYPHWIKYLPPAGADVNCIPAGDNALHVAITPEILAYIITVIQHLSADDEQQRDRLHRLIVETLPPSSERAAL